MSDQPAPITDEELAQVRRGEFPLTDAMIARIDLERNRADIAEQNRDVWMESFRLINEAFSSVKAEVAGYMRVQEEMADKVYAAEGECERLWAERVGAEETVALHRPGIERQLKQAIDTLKEIAALDPYGDTDNDDNIITAQRIAYNALAVLADPPGPEAKE